MSTPTQTIIALEKKFWQSMVDDDTDTATGLLCEPSLMVSAHGAIKFDRAGYRKMAEQGSQVVTSFELSDVDVVFPNDATAIVTYKVKQGIAPRGTSTSAVQEMNDSSTWVRANGQWQCAMHTETPIDAKAARH